MVKAYLGHDIPKGFLVHHISGDHNENRLDNFFLTVKAVHWKLHQTATGSYLHSNLDLIKEALDAGVVLDVKKKKKRKK